MIITTHYIEEASQADVVGFFFEREVGGFEIRCLSPLRLGRLDEKRGYLGSIVAAHSHGKTPIKSANRHSLSSSKSFFLSFLSRLSKRSFSNCAWMPIDRLRRP